jgi:hypothetical protein
MASLKIRVLAADNSKDSRGKFVLTLRCLDEDGKYTSIMYFDKGAMRLYSC